MRTLNEYFLSGGQMSDIGTAGNLSTPAVVTDDGKIVAVGIHVHTLVDAATSFDIMVNEVDSGVDAILPDATPDESGIIMNVSDIEVVEGDAITLQANGEPTAGIAEVTWIIRR